MQWLWLSVLGLVVGSGMGYLQSVKLGGSYRSVGKLRLTEVAQAREHTVDAVDRGPVGRPSSDATSSRTRLPLYRRTGEIRSEAVIRAAVNKGNIHRLPRFRGKSVDQVVEALRRSPDLETEVISVSSDAVILMIGYATADPSSAQLVVQSLMDAFSDHWGGADGEPLSNAIDASVEGSRAPAAGGPLELSDVDAALQRIESLESQYVQRLGQRESQAAGAESQASHRRHVKRLQSEQQTLSGQVERLQGQLDATRAAVGQGQSAEAALRLLRPRQAGRPAATEQAEGASQDSLRNAVVATQRQLAQLKEQQGVVDTEIKEQLEALRRSMVADAAVAQLMQEIETQHREYERAVASLHQGQAPTARVGSAVESRGCTEVQGATLGMLRRGPAVSAVVSGGAIGVSIALLASLGKRLTRRRV